MKSIKHMEQREDGGFDFFVVFGDKAPWDVPKEMYIKCASEEDADNLVSLVSGVRDHTFTPDTGL